MKICTNCKEGKPLEAFSKDSQKKDGLRSSCRECKKVYDKKYVEENKESKYAANYAYTASHRKEKAVYDKHRRDEFGDEIRREKRRYYHSGGKEVGDVWKKANKKLVRVYASKGAAKRRTLLVDSNLSHKEVLYWLESQDPVCTYCGTCCKEYYEIDHVIPLSRGGSHSLGNLAVSCLSCNRSKKDKLLEEWELTKKELIEARDKKP